MAEKLYNIQPPVMRTVLQPNNQFEKVFEVTIITKSGARESIEFTEDEYTPENVKKVLDERAALHEKIIHQ